MFNLDFDLAALPFGFAPNVRLAVLLHPREGLSAQEAIADLPESDAGRISQFVIGEARPSEEQIRGFALVAAPTSHVSVLIALFLPSPGGKPAGRDAEPDGPEFTLQEMFDHLRSTTDVAQREVWDCDAVGPIGEGAVGAVNVPIRLWEAGVTGLGQLLGARFELRRRGLRDAWVAFDAVDGGEKHLQVHFEKTLPFNPDAVAIVWKEMTAIAASMIRRTRSDD